MPDLRRGKLDPERQPLQTHAHLGYEGGVDLSEREGGIDGARSVDKQGDGWVEGEFREV